jgi:hypothetical protein
MKNARTCVVLLGMHRSGTSALGGMLDILGISMGTELMSATDANKKGYFENQNIFNFHDKELFPLLNSSWDDIAKLQTNWHLNSKLDDLYEEAKNIILHDYKNDNIFAIKDPRISLLFPFWEKVLFELNIGIKVLISLREPMEIAHSLSKRDGFQIEKSLFLWSKYLLFAEYYTRDFQRVFIDYHDVLKNTEVFLKIIKKIFTDKEIQINSAIRNELNLFIDKDLQHNKVSHAIPVESPIYIKNLYAIITSIKDNVDKNLYQKFDTYRYEYEHCSEFFINIQKPNKNIVNLYQSILYLDTGKGFNEEETIRINYDREHLTFSYTLKDYVDIQAIRFDPVALPCQISLDFIKINGLITQDISHNGLAIGEDIIYIHNDPQIIVTQLEKINIKEVNISMSNIQHLNDIMMLNYNLQNLGKNRLEK